MFWDRVAWVYDVFANGINRRANRAMCAAVAAHIGPEDEVLECACGTGLLTGVIAARCRALTATDFSEKMLAQAERKYANCRNVRFVQADITKLDYPDGRFDAVVAANVITCWTSRCRRCGSWPGSAARVDGSSSPRT